MTDAIQKLYQTDHLVRPAIPPRSRLYHLAPMGVGTANTESLTSYLMRLAQAHRVTVRKLAVHEIMPLLDRSCTQSSVSGIVAQHSRLLNGLGTQARTWVQALEELTLRDDLRFLTMLTWNQVLASSKLLRVYRAWCPACYNIWRQAGQAIYDPLLWALQVVTVCPSHQQFLQSRCPHPGCQRRLYPLASQGRPGFCPYCKGWLGATSAQQPLGEGLFDQAQDKQQFADAEAVGALIATAPALVTPPPRERIAQRITGYVNQFGQGKTGLLRRRLGLPPNRLLGWKNGRTVPQLKLLLDLCRRLDVSPCSFLTEPVELEEQQPSAPGSGVVLSGELSVGGTVPDRKRIQAALETALASDEEPPPAIRAVAARLQIAPNTLCRLCPELCQAIVKRCQAHRAAKKAAWRQALEAILDCDEVPPPSMQAVAQRLGCHQQSLRAHFPELARAISARYLAHRRAQAQQNQQRRCDEVRRLTFMLHQQGIYPSQHRVAARLSIPANFLYAQVRAAWHDALRELGLES
jgi:hypothetical protein